MADLLWLIPALPLTGFVILLFFGRRLRGRGPAVIGCLSVGLSMAAALALVAGFIGSVPPRHAITKTLYTWFDTGGFAASIGFYFDGLSLMMVAVITIVGFLIHIYSSDFMAADSSLPTAEDGEGYGRFFAYMNLFVGSMLVLVLADNLLLLYLGWEGVGLCSYLLIGFWYKDPANGRAAVKAFIVTRVGDASLAVGLFIIAWSFSTFDIQEAAARAHQAWPQGSAIAIAAAALLLGGAIGKSAQLPLQTWLPDAMAGPTPVSALIHAATMVTAGVYLIGRTHALFELAPPVLTAVSVIGAATLLIAGASALVQRDLKRILAYSTMSQVGYMFCALGVGAWSAAFFHFMTHAFFKALLFLSAGVVIKAMNNEHDIFKMGGLRPRLPSAWRGFLVGAASLAALPYVTAGFYSKDMILSTLLASKHGGIWLWGAGLLGAFMTSVYAFRPVFVVFFGEGPGRKTGRAGPLMAAPLFVLSIFAIGAGWLLPNGFAGPFLSGLFGSLPTGAAQEKGVGFLAALAPPVVAIAGVVLSGMLYLALPRTRKALTGSPAGAAANRFLFSGWGFDRIYGAIFVAPFVWAARVNRSDIIDLPFRIVGLIAEFTSRGLSLTQSGKVRWYAAAVALGGAVFLGLAVLL